MGSLVSLLQLQFRRRRLHWFQNVSFLKGLFLSSLDVDFWDSLFKSVAQKSFSGSSMSSKRSTSDFVDIVMAFLIISTFVQVIENNLP